MDERYKITVYYNQTYGEVLIYKKIRVKSATYGVFLNTRPLNRAFVEICMGGIRQRVYGDASCLACLTRIKILNNSGKHGPIYHLPQIGEPPPLSVQFLGVNYCNSDYSNIRELAKVTVFGFVRSGQGSVKVGTQTSIARQGDVFILPAGCYHEVVSAPKNEEQWSYIWLNINGNWILKMLEAYQLLTHIVVQNSGLEPLFVKLSRMLSTNPPMNCKPSFRSILCESSFVSLKLYENKAIR